MYQPITDLDYFQLLISDGDAIPLLEAAASLGLDAYPRMDLQGVLARFDLLAGQLAEECRGASTEMSRLRRVLRFFYGRLGFAGNLNDYYAADNSYLHRVLDTRRGIPISLAVLFSEFARHVGLEAEGVGFPGHFLVRVSMHQGVVILDPFTGQSLDQEELAQRAAPFGESLETLLRPASHRQILIRMLGNLRTVHLQQGQADLLEKVQARLRLLEQNSPAR